MAELLDRSLEAPALVIGSPPPHGNDLDLLIGPEQERAVEAILADAGFACQVVEPFRGYPRGFRIWASFRDCGADVVDAIPAGNFGLPPEEEERLEKEARPIPGFARLMRPAPSHVLLILAHNFLDPDDALRPLSPGRRRRVRRALDEEPAGWELAAELAPSWGAVEQLERLKAAFELGDAVDEPGSHGAHRPSLPRAIREYRRAWRSGRLIAISGRDPAQRSEQADGLRQALVALDIPARVVRPEIEPGAARASTMRRAVLPGLRDGDVVICDGYTLDALQGRPGSALFRLLVPPARRTFVIDGARSREDLCAEIALEVWQAVR